MIGGTRLPEALARALTAQGYLTLTPVQRAVLAVVPPSRDMLVSAATGSGKTVAFGLALAGQLLDGDGLVAGGARPRVVVITPTRELAQQVRAELAWLYAGAGATVVCCTGGMDMRAERASLAAGCAIVVGSPGRLRDHIERGALDMAALRCVVLDEADDMLDLGFRDDLEFILHAAGPDRQTLMFSATITARIEALAAGFQTGAVRIDAASQGGGADIRFEAMAIAPNDRENAIVNVLRYHEAQGAIVFCGRRETVAHLASRLDNRGFKVVTLSGAMSQKERTAAMAAMRDGRARVCVATDLAARGLDLPGLDLVIHADLPASRTALTHRSGRTGRAGRQGRAVLVVPHPLRRRAELMFRRAGIAVAWVAAPGAEVILARDEARLLAEAARDDAEGGAAERAAAARLLAALDPERLAIALVRQHALSRPAPEALIGAAGDFARLARPRLEHSHWFIIDCGRAERAEVRWLLPLICRVGHVTKQDVGRVVIGARETRFEIAATAVECFVAAVARSTEPGIAIRPAGAPSARRCQGARLERDDFPPEP